MNPKTTLFVIGFFRRCLAALVALLIVAGGFALAGLALALAGAFFAAVAMIAGPVAAIIAAAGRNRPRFAPAAAAIDVADAPAEPT